jgi:tripartite ATP-independent transporter DctM subunit
MRAMWEARWELLLPFVVIGSIFGGFATMVEAAAITVLYSVLVECVLYRDLDPWRDLPKLAVETAALSGAFLIILGVALGFTNYLTFAEVPAQALAWVRAHVESRWVFLLTLNAFLVVVGALMDIYSAIFVIAPLIIPMGAAYGIDPVHLGIVFLANMELGYLMPPMGENLFLSAFRFNQPLARVCYSTLPYTLILLATVLLITYVPSLTLGLVQWAGR